MRGKTDHPLSYAEAMKMKSLTFHTGGRLSDSLSVCSFSSSIHTPLPNDTAWRQIRHNYTQSEQQTRTLKR